MASVTRNEYAPDAVSLPGETLQEVLDERKMTQAMLALRTGRPKKTISEIVHGKSAITPEMAVVLERVLGISADFWTRLEVNYRTNLARYSDRARFADYTDWANLFPLKDLAELGSIVMAPDETDTVTNVLGFFGVASPKEWQQAYAQFESIRPPTVPLPVFTAWLRIGELMITGVSTPGLDRVALRVALGAARHLGNVPDGAEQTKRLLKGAGVLVRPVKAFAGMRPLQAVVRSVSSDRALIQFAPEFAPPNLHEVLLEIAKQILTYRTRKFAFSFPMAAGESAGTALGDKVAESGQAYDATTPFDRSKHPASTTVLQPKSPRKLKSESISTRRQVPIRRVKP